LAPASAAAPSIGCPWRCDWAAARRLLEDEVLAAVRDMAPFYDLFRRRIARLQIESPPPGWDGVFVAEEK